MFRPTNFNFLPQIIKHLIIINVIVFLGQYAINSINEIGSLYPFSSSKFKPFQIITHMFMHSTSTFSHIFFNMFALWMFGNMIENLWGAKRFLIYYLVCGLGAMICHQIVQEIQIMSLLKQGIQVAEATQGVTSVIIQDGDPWKLFFNEDGVPWYQNMRDVRTLGASGAVFGILLAFGMLFPNTEIYIWLLFPMKAKYFVIIYGVIELWSGFAANDNVAHFAHLGGMLFGFFMIKYWQKKRNNFY